MDGKPTSEDYHRLPPSPWGTLRAGIPLSLESVTMIFGLLLVSFLRCGRDAGGDLSGLRLRTQKQIERNEVRDHQQGHVEDRDCVGGS